LGGGSGQMGGWLGTPMWPKSHSYNFLFFIFLKKIVCLRVAL
jgi:hypothetical protein